MTWEGTKVLVTSKAHGFYGQVVTIIDRKRVQGHDFWIFEEYGTQYQLEDGQFKEIKVQ
jgi:hypothetical protein